MDVSIIIVNYNTVNLVIDAVHSIVRKTQDVKYEIIVVDNNSSDNSKTTLNDRFGDTINYIQLPENIGFGRANNEGAKTAKGRHLFFLNPDTELLNNAVKILSDFLDRNENVAVCGGNLFDGEHKPAQSYGKIFPSAFRDLNTMLGDFFLKMIYGKNYEFNHTKKPTKTAYITGADLMIKKDVFEDLSGFDADFFMYYEETELCYRVHQKYLIANTPDAKIRHLEGKSFSNTEKREQLKAASRKIFYTKTRSRSHFLIANFIVKFFSVIKIALFKLLKNQEKEVFWKVILKSI
jgi:GT2 family glycosyltransferase